MSDPTTNFDRLSDLVGTVCDDDASQNDLIELDSIVQVDRGARDWYRRYCRLHGTLRVELRAHRATRAVFEQIGISPTAALSSSCEVGSEAETPALPMPAYPSTTIHAAFGYSPKVCRWPICLRP